MKTSKTRVILSLLTLAALVPLTPHAYAQTNTANWQNPMFKGFDPYYCSSSFSPPCPITAYRTGTTAALSLSLENTFCSSVKIVYAQLQMDWGTNYTATGLPTTINLNNRGFVTISVALPGTSTASNLVVHDSLNAGSYLNITSPCFTGTMKNTFSSFGLSVPGIAVYSSDQADAMAVAQQLGTTPSITGGSVVGPNCGTFSPTFKTAQASSLCDQAAQQSNLGQQLYSTGNFTGAKADFQSALSLWNQAISAENSHGGTLELNGTVGGYGSLLLGIGAIVGGVAAIIYAIRRPKILSTTTTH